MKRVAFSFGAASILMLPFWLERFKSVGAPTSEVFYGNHYHFPEAYPLDYLSGLIVLLLATLVLFGIATLLARLPGRGRGLKGVASLLLWANFLNFLRISYVLYPTRPDVLGWLTAGFGSLVLAVVLATLLLFLLVRYYGRWTFAARLATGLGIPVGATIVFNALFGSVVLGFPLSVPPASYSEIDAGKTSAGNGLRVVWVIFDGLEEGPIFDDRDVTVQLPAFDRLKAQAFHARNAISPWETTPGSIARLFMGRANDGIGKDLQGLNIITAPGVKPVPLSSLPNVIDDANRQGVPVAIMNHSLIANPYCRMFHRQTAACWEADGWYTGGETVIGRLAFVVRSWLTTLPISAELRTRLFPFTGPNGNANRYRQFSKAVFRTLADPRYGLVFVHWMIPHYPWIFDRSIGSLTATSYRGDQDGYLDNLVLTDRAVADTVAAIDRSPARDRTVLIVTADHGWRDGHRFQVVFLVRMPGDRRGRVYDQKLPTIHTRAFIRALLDGSLRDTADVERFFREKGTEEK